jgi:hypothetical protein
MVPCSCQENSKYVYGVTLMLHAVNESSLFEVICVFLAFQLLYLLHVFCGSFSSGFLLGMEAGNFWVYGNGVCAGVNVHCSLASP